MVRIDLITGAVESVFTASGWLIGHPNPNPADADLLMCCQEWYGEDSDSEWGRAKVHELPVVQRRRLVSGLGGTGPRLGDIP